MYLLDTNVIIRAFKGREPDSKFLRKAIGEKKLSISVISIAEFLTKATREEKISFEKLTNTFPVLKIDEQVAKVAATYRKKYLKKSRAKLLDYLIAAQAKLNNLALVTNNKSDFPMKDTKIISP